VIFVLLLCSFLVLKWVQYWLHKMSLMAFFHFYFMDYFKKLGITSSLKVL
jgi:hypothetical protein